ncbi:solute carrier family 46 member 3-like [Mya arenaria]|uniref:solute carrier family 46 member 3-like n=1 Tax=Mya arenaria TaxID=6604 RepID=UPI0022E4135B|nr:solute carrier family 46 member 3-like [Mya arenaria]
MELEKEGEPFGSENESTPLLPENRDETATEVPSNVELGFTLRRCMLLPVILGYFLEGGMFMFLLPQYTQHVFKEKYTRHDQFSLNTTYNACANVNQSDPEYQIYLKIQRETAKWTIYYAIASLVPTIVGNIVWASLSDILGRKFVLYLTIAGAIVSIGSFALVANYKLSLYYIIIGKVLDGLTGSYTAFLAMMFTYTCDITVAGKSRTIAIVFMELLLGLTVTLASMYTGYFIEAAGFFWPSFMATCLLAAAFLILVIFVPETSGIQHQRGSQTEQLTASARVKRAMLSTIEAFKFYFTNDSKVRRLKYILLILGFLFLTIPYLNRGSMEILYQLGKPFCWSSRKIGWFASLKISIASVFGVAGTYLLQRCMKDDIIAMLGTAIGIASYVVEGFAHGSIIWLVPVLSAPTGLPIPMIRSLMSALTPADKQGALFASIGAVETLCALIGSVSNNAIYSATLTIMNGFVFEIMAAFTLIGVIFLVAYIFVARLMKDTDSRDDITITVTADQ